VHSLRFRPCSIRWPMAEEEARAGSGPGPMGVAKAGAPSKSAGSNPQQKGKTSQSPNDKVVAAIRLPAFKKRSGEEDEAAESDHHLLTAMVHECYKNRKHIQPCYTFLLKRKEKQDHLSEIALKADRFDALTTIAGLPDPYKISWIVSHSDLTAGDLISMMEHDPDSLNQLMAFALQFPAKGRLPMVLILKEVMQMFMEDRSIACGGRLATFKSKGGVDDKTKKLSWRGNGSYALRYDGDGKLIAIIHWSGTKIDVDPKYGITRDYDLVMNFDDFAAFFQYGCLPPIPVVGFFEKENAGPCQITHFVGKPKVLQTLAQQVYNKWEADKLEGLSSFTPTEQVSKALKDHHDLKVKASMKTARAKAAEAMKVKKARLTISMKP